jgi:hypothetical protein
MRWLAMLVLAGCSNPPRTRTGDPATCESLRPKLEQLYRAEGSEREPKRVDEYVADNTTMVIADCTKQGGKTAGCIQGAASIPEIERTCLLQLDDEGSEGLEHRK